jgi:hypothetical protein
MGSPYTLGIAEPVYYHASPRLGRKTEQAFSLIVEMQIWPEQCTGCRLRTTANG